MAGIYIHVPFCKTRCIYCDFYSTTQINKKRAYVETVKRELVLRKNYLRNEELERPFIDTVYFGGGTPSQLDFGEIEDILSCIYKEYAVSTNAEITIECNPDDLNVEACKRLSVLFNRFSIGIQSFNEGQLRFIKRRHTAEQAIDAVKCCKEAGIHNISVDLIYGFPRQTVREWEADIEQVLELHVPHISAYALIYEEETLLWKYKEQNIVSEIDENLSIDMYNSLIDHLKAAGYEHYEISNFAKPGFISRHNSSYWRNVPYLGCGPSAHSYDGKSRQWNIADVDLYIKGVNSCFCAEDMTSAQWFEREELDLYTRYNDFVLTTLRTIWGMDLGLLEVNFGRQLTDYCLKMAEKHLRAGTLEVEIVEKGKNKEQTSRGLLKLTRRGLFLSDGIISDLLYIDD